MPQDRSSRRRVWYFLEAPLRRPRLVIAPSLLVSLAAVALALLLPARYRAEALVRSEWETGDDALPGRRGADVADRWHEAVRRRVTDRALLERTLEQATPYEAGGADAAALAEQVERLRADLRVRPIGASSFAVEFEHSDPVKAALVPNLLVHALVEETDRAQATRTNREAIVRYELVTPAISPAAAQAREPVRFGLAGALLGLWLGLLAAVAAEQRDRSVKGPEDLVEILDVPLLATLPEVRGRRD